MNTTFPKFNELYFFQYNLDTKDENGKALNNKHSYSNPIGLGSYNLAIGTMILLQIKQGSTSEFKFTKVKEKNDTTLNFDEEVENCNKSLTLETLKEYKHIPKSSIYALSANNGNASKPTLIKNIVDSEKFINGLKDTTIETRKFKVKKTTDGSISNEDYDSNDIIISVNKDLEICDKNFYSEIFSLNKINLTKILYSKEVQKRTNQGKDSNKKIQITDIIEKLGTSNEVNLGYKTFQEIFLNNSFNKTIEKESSNMKNNLSNKEDTNNSNNKLTMILNNKKQIILYGPAGTGKTFSTKNIIVNHNDNTNEDLLPNSEIDKRYKELKEQGKIKFVTFHQSFAYEDFIEGIKPSTDENGNISYYPTDGIFKELCNEAKKITYKNKESRFNSNTPIWKISLGGSGDNEIKEDCYRNSYIRFSYEHEYDKDLSSYNHLNGPLDRLYNEMQIGDIVVSLDTWKSISQIGIITGNYEYLNDVTNYKHARKVEWLLESDETIDFFHINNNTNFANAAIHRIYPNTDKFFNLFPNKVQKIPNLESNNYYLIIDEINRGNISKIFGELITLLEASKRFGEDDELTTTLPYSKKEFGIPPNLYIIGTMNTSDKSIAHLDIALRRRFGFVEMLPDYERITDDKCRKLLQELNHRIEILLDKDHLIGHSFFITRKDKKGNEIPPDVNQIMQYEIVPLLEEYFYGDYEKIQSILGNNNLSYEEIKLGNYSKNIYTYWFDATDKGFDETLSSTSKDINPSQENDEQN